MNTTRIALWIACAAALLPLSFPIADARPPDDAEPQGRPVIVPRAEQFDIRSKAGPTYRVFVAPPAGEAPEVGWPVIYATDGNVNFLPLIEAVRRQAREGPRALVVGIGYPEEEAATYQSRRSVDLVPPPKDDAARPAESPGGSPGTAGNDAFLAFIEGELKPIVERRFRVDRGRQALFGHSFGGHFVLHALFRKPGSFRTYLASSPSIWWNDGSLLAEERDFAGRHAGKALDAKLLITTGEREQAPAPGTPPERARLLEQRRMVGGAKDLAERLGALGVEGLEVAFRMFPEEDHGSVVLPAASRGVRFAFEGR